MQQGDKRVHRFPKGISLKVNIITWLKLNSESRLSGSLSILFKTLIIVIIPFEFYLCLWCHLGITISFGNSKSKSNPSQMCVMAFTPDQLNQLHPTNSLHPKWRLTKHNEISASHSWFQQWTLYRHEPKIHSASCFIILSHVFKLGITTLPPVLWRAWINWFSDEVTQPLIQSMTKPAKMAK